MVTHRVELIFRCDESGDNFLTTADVIRALVKAGLDVEAGADVLIVGKLPPL